MPDPSGEHCPKIRRKTLSSYFGDSDSTLPQATSNFWMADGISPIVACSASQLERSALELRRLSKLNNVTLWRAVGCFALRSINRLGHEGLLVMAMPIPPTSLPSSEALKCASPRPAPLTVLSGRHTGLAFARSRN